VGWKRGAARYRKEDEEGKLQNWDIIQTCFDGRVEEDSVWKVQPPSWREGFLVASV
jgi:hypothetical protein